jgi:hypothetical protein
MMEIMVTCSKCGKHFMVAFTGTSEEIAAFLRDSEFICDNCTTEAK